MTDLPTIGLKEVDDLILYASEHGISIPPDTQRWKILLWAAEAVQARRDDPAAWARDGLRKLTAEHFK